VNTTTDDRSLGTRGFTLLEITVSLLIMSLALAGLSVAFGSYNQSTSARRAAEVFAYDLSVGRSFSVRTRDTVKVVFSETTPSYTVESLGGDTLVQRSFTATSEFKLDTLDLQATGDSIYFDTRGRINFGGITGSIGVARFIAGGGRYQVRFNVLGTSRVSPL
jgi:prepilin-type N-terminal cleavage/methylation domain-containing protein